MLQWLWKDTGHSEHSECPEYISSSRCHDPTPLKENIPSHSQVEFSVLCFSGSRHFWSNFTFKLMYAKEPIFSI